MGSDKMKKKIGIGLIFILLIIGGFFLWKNDDDEVNLSEEANKEREELEDKEVEESMFKDYYREAKALVEEMTLEEKVGQLFLVRYEKSEIEKYKDFYPGGYILFAKDFADNTMDSMKKELDDLQALHKYPLVLGVDEEGGSVTRVSRYPAYRMEKFSAPKYYYETGGYELLEEVEKEKAKLLKGLGLNLNLAPVADVSTSEEDYIYYRAFGYDALKTAEFIKNMVTYARESDISSCLKHFPGYGDNKDTHTGIAIDDRSYESFVENDFLPFKAGIEAGTPCVLVSHNIVNSIDNQYPSSLSEKVIKELRDTLSFTGIILTDDLAMDAVKSYVENNEAATLAINAGNDMIITSDFLTMYQEVLNSVQEGKISVETINKAVLRIISWKYYSHLF